MQPEWYCRIAGKNHGPLTATDVKKMAQQGRLAPDDEVRKGEAGRWLRAGEMKGLPFPAAEEPSAERDSADAKKPAREGRVKTSSVSPVLWLLAAVPVVGLLMLVVAGLLFVVFGGRSGTVKDNSDAALLRQARADAAEAEERDKKARAESEAAEKEERERKDRAERDAKMERDRLAREKIFRDEEDRLRREREEKERLQKEQEDSERAARLAALEQKKRQDEEKRLADEKALAQKRKEEMTKPVPVQLDQTPYLSVKFTNDSRFGITVVNDPFKERNGRAVKLTYSDDGATNNTLFAVDGRVVPFDGGRLKPEAYKEDGFSGWKSSQTYAPARIRVTQDVSIRRGDQSQKLDVCLVRYTLKNEDVKAHKLGIRAMIDTLIGNNDGVPFTIPGLKGLCRTSYRSQKARDVPDFIQVLEKPDLRNPGVVAQLGLRLSGKLSSGERPDSLVLTRWPGGAAGWQVPVTPFSDDSAVLLYWLTRSVPAGESREVAYTYGLGNVDSGVGGNLAVTLGGSFKRSGEFTITAYVKNGVRGETATLKLPDTLQLVDSTKEPLRREVPYTTSEPITQISWRVKSLDVGRLQVTVTLNSGSSKTKVILID